MVRKCNIEFSCEQNGPKIITYQYPEVLDNREVWGSKIPGKVYSQNMLLSNSRNSMMRKIRETQEKSKIHRIENKQKGRVDSKRTKIDVSRIKLVAPMESQNMKIPVSRPKQAKSIGDSVKEMMKKFEIQDISETVIATPSKRLSDEINEAKSRSIEKCNNWKVECSNQSEIVDSCQKSEINDTEIIENLKRRSKTFEPQILIKSSHDSKSASIDESSVLQDIKTSVEKNGKKKGFKTVEKINSSIDNVDSYDSLETNTDSGKRASSETSEATVIDMGPMDVKAIDVPKIITKNRMAFPEKRFEINEEKPSFTFPRKNNSSTRNKSTIGKCNSIQGLRRSRIPTSTEIPLKRCKSLPNRGKNSNIPLGKGSNLNIDFLERSNALNNSIQNSRTTTKNTATENIKRIDSQSLRRHFHSYDVPKNSHICSDKNCPNKNSLEKSKVPKRYINSTIESQNPKENDATKRKKIDLQTIELNINPHNSYSFSKQDNLSTTIETLERRKIPNVSKQNLKRRSYALNNLDINSIKKTSSQNIEKNLKRETPKNSNIVPEMKNQKIESLERKKHSDIRLNDLIINSQNVDTKNARRLKPLTLERKIESEQKCITKNNKIMHRTIITPSIVEPTIRRKRQIKAEKSIEFNTNTNNNGFSMKAVKPTNVSSQNMDISSKGSCLKYTLFNATRTGQDTAESSFRKTFELDDRYCSLAELDTKTNDLLHGLELPITIVKQMDARIFMSMTSSVPLRVKFSLIIDKSLYYQLYCEEKLISQTETVDVVSKQRLDNCSAIKKVLRYANELYKCKQEERNDEREIIRDIQKKYKERTLIRNKKVAFILEQLSLLFTPEYNRKFTESTLALAVTWEQTSPETYKKIVKDNILALPSVDDVRSVLPGRALSTNLDENALDFLASKKPLDLYSEIPGLTTLHDLYMKQEDHSANTTLEIHEREVRLGKAGAL